MSRLLGAWATQQRTATLRAQHARSQAPFARVGTTTNTTTTTTNPFPHPSPPTKGRWAAGCTWPRVGCIGLEGGPEWDKQGLGVGPAGLGHGGCHREGNELPLAALGRGHHHLNCHLAALWAIPCKAAVSGDASGDDAQHRPHCVEHSQCQSRCLKRSFPSHSHSRSHSPAPRPQPAAHTPHTTGYAPRPTLHAHLSTLTRI